MLRNIIVLLFIVLSLSCYSNSNTQKQVSSPSNQIADTTDREAQIKCALDFNNGYVGVCNKQDKGELIDQDQWVYANPLVSEGFKKEMKHILKAAYEEDPEYGLGFDPVLNAQDYPDDGFQFDSFDVHTGILMVKGIDKDGAGWDSFKVQLKIKKEDGKWLVDGCGFINIPQQNPQ